jgi:DTW domain-containing protein
MCPAAVSHLRDHQDKKIDKADACPLCLRPKLQCMCGRIQPLDNMVKVLILQFPREQFKLLNSATLCAMALRNCVLRVGLSWRGLSHALGHEAVASEWGVLHLGSGPLSRKPLEIVDKKKRPVDNAQAIKGIVVLDGSWKQAKTLWWRNPWLLRLNRIVLNPAFGSARQQAKKGALSTAEALAFALGLLGEEPNVPAQLERWYDELIIRPNI